MAGDRSFYHVAQGEDIGSVLRGVKSAAGRQVAVVLPADATLFHDDLNLRLLLIYAREGGKEPVLVTQDAVVLKLAKHFGLPVYPTPQKAWQAEEYVEEPADAMEITQPLPVAAPVPAGVPVHRRRRRRPAMVWLLAVLLFFLVATGFWLWNGLRVTVVVTPQLNQVEQVVEVPLLATPVAAGTAAVRAYDISMPVEAAAAAPATGRRTIGVAAATGTVLFFNETSHEVQVAKGTLLATDGGTRFVTTAAVKVPPVTVEYYMQVPTGTRSGQAEAPVAAVQPGSAGNVAAGRIRLLPQGANGLKVTNPEPTRNGTDQVRPVILATDVATVSAKAKNALNETWPANIAARLGAGAYLNPAATVLEQVEVTVAPTAGSEAAEVRARARAVAKGQYVVLAELAQAAIAAARDALPAGIQPAGAGMAEYITSIVPGQNRLTVAVRFPAGAAIEPAAAVALLAGRTLAEARQFFQQNGMPAELEIKGGKSHRLPNWKGWIKVTVAEPATPVQTAEAPAAR